MLEGIKRDTADGSMKGIERALSRLETLTGPADSDSDDSASDPASLTLAERRMKARAQRLAGVPACIDVHQDLGCRCCVFES